MQSLKSVIEEKKLQDSYSTIEINRTLQQEKHQQLYYSDGHYAIGLLQVPKTNKEEEIRNKDLK